MAVKFEFTLSDIDAENLFSAVRNDALKTDVLIFDYMGRTDITDELKKAYVSHLKATKEYTLGLLDKMTHSRIDE